jgi:large subunit ribosomal protein L16
LIFGLFSFGNLSIFSMNINFKYRKPFKPYATEKSTSKSVFNMKGNIALKVVETNYVTATQLEAGRIAIGRVIKRKASVRVFVNGKPDRIVTAKPLEVRMGKGKGSMDKLLFIVKPGYVLYELRGVEFSKAYKALLNAQKKLACRTIIFTRPRFRHEQD